MKFVFHYGLQSYIIFLFLSCQRFVAFVQTNHIVDDSHSNTSHPTQTHRDGSHTLDHSPDPHTDAVRQPESHTDAVHQLESHTDAVLQLESHTDAVHQPESHTDSFHRHSESLNPEFHTHASSPSHESHPSFESHTHPINNHHEPRNVHESHTDASSHHHFSHNDLSSTDGFQTQETRHFISIISKSFIQRIPTTRIPYFKLNHTNYWPFNMERVRLPPGYQSPINIHTNKIEEISMPPLDTHSYEELDESAELICFNTGQTIECKVKNGTNPPYIQGGPLPAKYIFDNMHWHWGRGSVGSEHLINGIPYAAEVHVVHYKEKYGSFEKARKKQDGLAIFALFGRITSDDNSDLEIHFNHILQHLIVPAKVHPSKWQDVFKFIHKIVLNNQEWMTYPGSLTSAPYKESVTWLVYFQCFNISLNQLDALRSTLTINGHKHPVHRRPVYDLRGDNRPMLARENPGILLAQNI